MARITIVRHGQASFGSDNYDLLSELGHEQSRVLGQHLRSIDDVFDSIHCGTLQRHKQTLNGILQAYPEATHANYEAGLNEFQFQTVIKAYLIKHNLGLPEKSAPRRDFYRLLKTAMLHWQTGELDTYGVGETWQAFNHRVVEVFDAIVSSPAKHHLIVTSGGVMGIILKHILGAPDKTAVELNLQIRNASVTRCFSSRDGVALSEFNNVDGFHRAQVQGLITYS